jgi:hypothetical protein
VRDANHLAAEAKKVKAEARKQKRLQWEEKKRDLARRRRTGAISSSEEEEEEELSKLRDDDDDDEDDEEDSERMDWEALARDEEPAEGDRAPSTEVGASASSLLRGAIPSLSRRASSPPAPTSGSGRSRDPPRQRPMASALGKCHDGPES